MKNRKNMKEAVVLFIAAMLVLTAVVATANTEFKTDEKLIIEAVSDNSELIRPIEAVKEITEPSLVGGERVDFLEYHDGHTENAWKYTDNSPWSCAIQLTDALLAPYRDYNITEVMFSCGCDDYGFCIADYEIWISDILEDPNAPPVVYGTGTSSGTGWDTVPLDMAYDIPDTGDVYLGITYSNYFDFPAGVDDNNYVPEGFWFYYGEWVDGGSVLGPSVWGLSAGVTAGGEPPAIPDLDCSGELNFVDVEPNGTVSGTITVENVGEPDSELNWEVQSYPEWGNWSFDPESGTGLAEGASVDITVGIVAPDEPETTFEGEVVLVNSDDSEDTCTIQVSLVTPVSQSYPFLEFLAQKFPILAKILELIF